MRIYDIDKSMDALIDDGEYQVEIIGEDGHWTLAVSRREWSDELQRHVYADFMSTTCRGFLETYDMAASAITRDRKNRKG